MAGDAINDALALARAHVGITDGRGDGERGVTLVKGDLCLMCCAGLSSLRRGLVASLAERLDHPVDRRR
jgi:cation transport ATPase